MYVSWVALHRLLGSPTIHTSETKHARRELLRWTCGCRASLETLRFYDLTPCAAHAHPARAASFVVTAAR